MLEQLNELNSISAELVLKNAQVDLKQLESSQTQMSEAKYELSENLLEHIKEMAHSAFYIRDMNYNDYLNIILNDATLTNEEKESLAKAAAFIKYLSETTNKPQVITEFKTKTSIPFCDEQYLQELENLCIDFAAFGTLGSLIGGPWAGVSIAVVRAYIALARAEKNYEECLDEASTPT